MTLDDLELNIPKPAATLPRHEFAMVAAGTAARALGVAMPNLR
jgi:hypothetical protein